MDTRRLVPPFIRQFAGDPLGLGRAAQSKRSARLTARTRTADRIVQSICPYCAVGCGQKVYVKNEKVVQIEGDPDSPISRGRLSAIVYSVGWTHQTVGVQNIRGASIIQLLLGNIGRPGGGILALRGHANIQGSTDIPTLYDILPGYIPMPHPQSGARGGSRCR